MFAIEKHFSKFAKFCGLKTPAERGYDPIQETMQALENDTMGAKPLSHSLLYEYCDDESGVFFNKGSIGCWFEIAPIVGSNDSIEKNLTLFFADELPEGGYLQFLIVASHDVSNILDMWEKGRKHGSEELKRLTAYRRHFIEGLASDFSNANDGRLARNYRSFVTYSTKDTGDKGVEGLLKFKKKLYNKLRAENLSPRQCTADDLILIGRDILQMSMSKQSKPRYNVLNNLSDQIALPFEPNTVEIDQINHHKSRLVSKVFAPRELPESFCLAEMINLLGSDHRSIPGRFVISYTVANNLGAKGISAMNTAGTRSIHAAQKSYTKNDLVAQEEARQWVEVKALHKKGESFLQESMLVMLTAPKEEIEIAEEVLKSLYNTNDWKLEPCKRIMRISSLAMLPMMQYSYWQPLKFFRLTRYALSGEVVAKLPIQGEWKGVPTSGALFVGRRGQLFNWDPFYRIGGGGNYNFVVMGPSGAGKTFFLLELVQSMIAKDVAVFVLDIGASYKNTCKILDGEMIQFNHSCNISLNPFAALADSGAVLMKALQLIEQGIDDEEIRLKTGLMLEKIEALRVGKSGASAEVKESEGIEILEIKGKDELGNIKTHFVTKDSIIYAKAMLSTMCGVNGDVWGEAIIERAINEGIAEYGRELDITKLCQVLDNLKDRKGEAVEGASKFADCLYPYTEEGTHGRFFASGTNANFKSALTVFELEELKNDEPLLAVVLQVILMQITMQFLCGDRSRRFMLIVDEAWLILDFAANFLERFARTVRKYGGSLGVCTQDLSSFSNACGTRKSQAAVLECSTWKLILQQKEEGVASFNASESYRKFAPLISTIRKCSQNKFSEVLINTDGATVVGRLVTDAYSTAMFSTEDVDFKFLIEKERQGLSKHEAIMALSKKYGILPDLESLKREENA
jgi:conjugal transfer ATP-binding protein TraC